MQSSMSYIHFALSAALLLGCSRPAERSDSPAAAEQGGGTAEPSPPAEPANPGGTMNEDRRKKPEPPRNFVDGPTIDPPAKLLEWLEKTATAEPKRHIRLPVVVRFADQHRIGLAGGHIGVSLAVTPDAIQVSLDDTAMGISLLDRVRDACPDEKQTACAVWLEGRWAGGPDRKFRVFSLVGANPPEPPGGGAPIHALIEADAP
jgi:hypothetical protein